MSEHRTVIMFGVHIPGSLAKIQPDLLEGFYKQEGRHPNAIEVVMVDLMSASLDQGYVVGRLITAVGNGQDGDTLCEIEAPSNQDIGRILEAQVRAGHEPPTMPKLYMLGRWA